jgi:hypothetical protein
VSPHQQTLASYVPTARLAQLLMVARGNEGVSLEEMADRFDGRYTVFDLMQLEAAVLRTTDDDLRAIAKAYGLDYTLFAPARGILRIDLAALTISIGETESAFAPGSSSTEVLVHYLALLYNMRSAVPGKPGKPGKPGLGTNPGESLVLRDPDLKVLAETFDCPVHQIEHALIYLMTNNAPDIRKHLKALTKRPSLLQRIRG